MTEKLSSRMNNATGIFVLREKCILLKMTYNFNDMHERYTMLNSFIELILLAFYLFV